jgi:NTP pyrophosphatase (non-canonical NTP hydrolase)
VDSLGETIERIVKFRDDRDWREFHTLRNLAAALAIGTGELQEALLWKSDQEITEWVARPEGKARVASEIGDVLIFALLFCHTAGSDPIQANQAQEVQGWP